MSKSGFSFSVSALMALVCREERLDFTVNTLFANQRLQFLKQKKPYISTQYNVFY